MSKEVVDYILENDVNVGLIPSRRQIEYNGGYVNNWTTEEFSKYVAGRKIIERDHGGPLQGSNEDDGSISFDSDTRHFNMVHVDVWKQYKNIYSAAEATAKIIKDLYSKNSNLRYEIGTEEAIQKMTSYELDLFVMRVKELLTEDEFSKILFIVVQCGTRLSKVNNNGVFDDVQLEEFIKVVKKYNKLSKEHNGDYIDSTIRKIKFSMGLDAINIAPELGMIQTRTILETLSEDEIETFYKICFESKKWVKWVDSNFKPDENKKELILICGHYCFTNDTVKQWIHLNIDKITDTFKKFFSEL